MLDIIQIESPVTFLKCKEQAMIQILLCARDAQHIYLRRQFEESSTNAMAMATIEVAQALGFNKLAEELKAEYYQSINKEAV